MANPQIENGFTKIANETMEALMRTRIPGEARQILDTVIRKTCGWNKQEDIISLSQFNLFTGIVKPSLIRGIKQLLSMNLIYKKAKGKNSFYCFNKDFSTWKPLAKKLTISKNANNHLQKSKFSLAKKLHTKESIKRKYQKKESAPSLEKLSTQKSEAYKAAELLFNLILKNNPHSRLHACQNGDKERTIQRWARDIDLLISKDGQETSIIEEVIRWCQQDNFWRSNILSGAKLREKWDTLVAQLGKKKEAEDEEYTGPVDECGNPMKTLSFSLPRRKSIQEKFRDGDFSVREDEDVIIDPGTGGPAKILKITSTRLSAYEKLQRGQT